MMRKHIHVLFDLKLKRFTLPQTCTAKFIRRCKIYVHYTVFFTIFAPCPRIKFSFIVLHESVEDPISICECRRFCSLIMLTARMPYNGRASFVFTLQPVYTLYKCTLQVYAVYTLCGIDVENYNLNFNMAAKLNKLGNVQAGKYVGFLLSAQEIRKI